MYFIDTHAHLYLPEYDADRPDMIKRAVDAGVQQMLLPAIDSRTTPALLAMADSFPCCLPMAGLHPTSVREDFKDELLLVEQQLASRKYCAIGEVGIDLYWDTSFRGQQIEAFGYQVSLAARHGLPLVIHTRNSMEVALEVVKSHCPTTSVAGKARGVFHCFPGTVDQAKEVIGLGFLLGIGGVLTYKNALMAKVVEEIPLEYLVLETDAPFLTPVPKRGSRNESAYIPFIARKIAEIKAISLDSVADATTRNARELFSLGD